MKSADKDDRALRFSEEVITVSVSPVPTPTSGPSPFVAPLIGNGEPPRSSLTPNPFGIPDSIVLDGAQRAADRAPADLLNAYNSVIGDDLNAVGDSKQSAQSRLLHGGLALGTVLTLPGAPELFGLTFAAKQTVKGGIEQLTFHAIDDAASNGAKLILQDGARLNPAESKIASELVARGHDVVAQAPSKIGRSADFVIDGKPTELKTMANVRPDAAGHGLTDLIIKAGKQAHNVIIDARNQRGLTQVKIRSAVENAFGKTSKSDLKSVHVLGRNGSESFEIRMSRS